MSICIPLLHLFKMQNSILVKTFSFLVFSLFELDIAIFFQFKSCCYFLLISHHPFRYSTIVKINKLNSKDHICSTRNLWRRSHFTICKIRMNLNLAFLSNFHCDNGLVPALNNVMITQDKFKRLILFLIWIDSGSILKHAMIPN